MRKIYCKILMFVLASMLSVGAMAQDPLKFTSTGKSTVQLVQHGNPNAVTMYISMNGKAFTSYAIGEVIELENGESVSFKNTKGSNFSSSENDYYQFVMTGSLAASGSIRSLVNNANQFMSYAFINYLWIAIV